MRNSVRAFDSELHLHSQTNPRLHEATGPLMITKGVGARVFDDGGKEYIEGMSGLWCASLGFSDHRLARVAFEQMNVLGAYHTANHRSNEPVSMLLDAIADISPISPCRIYFAATGSEANETMLKLSWYYNTARGKPAKRKIISRTGAYHGSTIMASALSGLPHMHAAFNLSLQDVIHVQRPHYFRDAMPDESPRAFSERLAKALEETIEREGADNIAAMIVEPVMGAGGVFVPPADYFPLIQDVLRRHDILLLADEIICGFGRTGNWFGSQTLNFQPDMMSIAKGLSAGHLPISAVVFSDEIYQVIADLAAQTGVLGHGFTYSGHPVTAAVALEAIHIYHEIDVRQRARTLGAHLMSRLRTALSHHELVGEIRGIGLLAAVELMASPSSRRGFKPEYRIGAMVEEICRSHGAIVRNMGDTIAFSPPFVISPEEIDLLVERVAAALGETAAIVRRDGLAAE